MSDVAIRVEGLGKSYQIARARGSHEYSTLQETIVDLLRRPFRARDGDSQRTVWALHDVSFEIEQGAALGVIGRNGAGKSTLLKILSRITEPTCGYADVYGRVGSLLEVGTGFHPELTARENVFLNGAILGLRRTEILRRFDEIIAFAEVEQFVDTPVKRFSSGMYMRLAFAVAAHLEPEILLVDEVLAVGDAAFQKKCLGRMSDVARAGRTVLFVSHNMTAMEALCQRAILLDGGKLVRHGPAPEVISQYLAAASTLSTQPLAERTDRKGAGRLRFSEVTLTAPNSETPHIIRSGDDLELSVSYASDQREHKSVVMQFGIYTRGGECLIVLNNEIAGAAFPQLPGEGRARCLIEDLPLAPGQYDLHIYCEVNGVAADWVLNAATLSVEPADFFGTGRLPAVSHGILVAQKWSADAV